MENLREENAGVKLLQAGFALGIPYVVVPTADLQASIHGVPNSPWSGFYERYPDSGGFIVGLGGWVRPSHTARDRLHGVLVRTVVRRRVISLSREGRWRLARGQQPWAW